jgi:hypothetical protein
MDAESRPILKRNVPWPVFLVVIAVGIAVFYLFVVRPSRVAPTLSECSLSESCDVTQQECETLWPGHYWDGDTCAVNLGNPNAVSVGS